MEHTPGPWKLRDDNLGYGIFKYRVGYIAEVYKTTDDIPALPTEGEANAYLIAAAPDLLAALKTLEEDYLAYRTNGEVACEWCGVDVEEKGHADDCPFAAIAKARGNNG